MDDPTRVRVEVELDKELVELAATAGLDLNEVAGRALKRALGVKAILGRARPSLGRGQRRSHSSLE